MSWLTKVEAWGWRTVDAFMVRLNALNMTNARASMSLTLIEATGIVYLGLAIKWALIPDTRLWTPDWQWLAFLGVLSGLDIAQFSIKRNTTPEGLVAKAAQRQSDAQMTTTTTTEGPSKTVTEPTA